MSALSWVFGLTFALAAILSTLELFTSLRKPPSWRAGIYILVRVSLDGISSLIVLAFLQSAYNNATWFSPLVQVAVSGVLGPAVLRSQIELPGGDNQARRLGLQVLYGRIRASLDVKIDNISAVAESRWIQSIVLPKIKELGVDYLASRIEYYMRSLERLDQEQKEVQVRFVKQLEEEDTFEEAKGRALLQYLMDNGGRSVVKSLCRERNDSV